MRREAGIVLGVLSFVLIMLVAAEIYGYVSGAKPIGESMSRMADVIVVALVGIIGNTRKDIPKETPNGEAPTN